MTDINRRGFLLATGAAAIGASLVSASAAHAAVSQKRIAIVGSGYGGSVAARRLTEAGYAVDLFEMGQDWDKTAPVGQVFSKMTAPDARSMWFERKTDMPVSYFFGLDFVNRSVPYSAGALAVERFASMKVYAGRGLGGGSLVNGGMAVVPRRSFFQTVLPQVDADEMYGKFFPKANAALGVGAPPANLINYSQFYAFSRTGAAQNAAANFKTVTVPNVYDWDYLIKETYKGVPQSALAQEVIFGNNYGKKSLPRTYLRDALATGRLNVISLTQVTRIRRSGEGKYVLTLKAIDPSGATRAVSESAYDRVVLAAGSVGTARLLTAAKATGDLPLNDAVGRKWGPNGNVMFTRSLRGANSSTGMYQSAIPAQALDAWDDSPQSVFAELAPMPMGIETWTSTYLALTNNPNLADFVFDKTTGQLALTWSSAMASPSVSAAKTVADRLNQANGGFTRTDMYQGGKAFADYFTYHPLGGAVIGEATDLRGELIGAPGIFVMDASLIPGRLGVNPFVTITALAERNMEKLLTAGRFT